MFRICASLLVFLLLVLSPVYPQVSPGGGGLYIPANNFAWIVVWSFCLLVVLRVVVQGSLVWSVQALVSLVLFLLVLISGFFVGVLDASSWFFRVLSLLGGLLLFWCVLQLPVSRAERGVCWLFFVGALLFAASYFFERLGVGRAAFGQVNLLATACVVGLLSAVYLQVSGPEESGLRLGSILLGVGVFWLSLFVFSLGSRVGVLSLSVGLLLMVLSFAFARPGRQRLLFSVFLVVVAFGVSSALGFNERVVDKFDKLAGGVEVRYYLYGSALELIEDNARAGLGYGGYERAASNLMGVHNTAKLAAGEAPVFLGDSPLTHPHNEILYWVAEGGGWGVSIVVCFFVFVGACFFAETSKRSFGLLAVACPFLLHMLVELPFYLSAWHWFGLVILLAIASISGKEKEVLMSPFSKIIGGILSAFPLVFIAFHIATLQSLSSMYSYFKNENVAELSGASENFYLSDFVEVMIVRHMFYEDLAAGRADFAPLFIQVAESYLRLHSNPVVYYDLCRAYLQLGDVGRFESVYDLGSSIYPHYEGFKELSKAREQVGFETAR